MHFNVKNEGEVIFSKIIFRYLDLREICLFRIKAALQSPVPPPPLPFVPAQSISRPAVVKFQSIIEGLQQFNLTLRNFCRGNVNSLITKMSIIVHVHITNIHTIKGFAITQNPNL